MASPSPGLFRRVRRGNGDKLGLKTKKHFTDPSDNAAVTRTVLAVTMVMRVWVCGRLVPGLGLGREV